MTTNQLRDGCRFRTQAEFTNSVQVLRRRSEAQRFSRQQLNGWSRDKGADSVKGGVIGDGHNITFNDKLIVTRAVDDNVWLEERL